jgi:hypothetical protein
MPSGRNHIPGQAVRRLSGRDPGEPTGTPFPMRSRSHT